MRLGRESGAQLMADRHAWLASIISSRFPVGTPLQACSQAEKCPGPGRCVFSCFGETACLDVPCFSFLSPLALLGPDKGGYRALALVVRSVSWLGEVVAVGAWLVASFEEDRACLERCFSFVRSLVSSRGLGLVRTPVVVAVTSAVAFRPSPFDSHLPWQNGNG